MKSMNRNLHCPVIESFKTDTHAWLWSGLSLPAILRHILRQSTASSRASCSSLVGSPTYRRKIKSFIWSWIVAPPLSTLHLIYGLGLLCIAVWTQVKSPKIPWNITTYEYMIRRLWDVYYKVYWIRPRKTWWAQDYWNHFKRWAIGVLTNKFWQYFWREAGRVVKVYWKHLVFPLSYKTWLWSCMKCWTPPCSAKAPILTGVICMIIFKQNNFIFNILAYTDPEN